MIPRHEYQVRGFSLESIGLEKAIVRTPCGGLMPIQGFACYRGMTIIDSMLYHYEPCEVFADIDSLLLHNPIRLH